MPTLSLDVPPELIKDPSSWSIADIGVWLQWLGIGEHAAAFAAQGVDGHALLRLSTEAAWADLGVVDPAQQHVLDSAVEPLRGFSNHDGAETGLALHAVEGPLAGEVVFVGAGGITGGRHSVSNGIVLSENYVSRRHFQITVDDSGQQLLQDVGSTTGTFLMVREELPLDHLMILQLGTTELTVYMEEDGSCTLVATEGPHKDARATVRQQGLFIGRETSNGLCIRDPQISSFHCEVRHHAEHGFILDDKYSTNRTWLRLAPDGQPSKRYVLRIGDLFKVGSTLFHVIDPVSIPEPGPPGAAAAAAAAAAVAAGAQMQPHAGASPVESRPATSHRSLASSGMLELASSADAHYADDEEEDDPSAEIGGSSIGSSEMAGSNGAPGIGAPGLRWEPFVEGDTRPMLPADEYSRRVTASRMQMAEQMHAQGPRMPPSARENRASLEQRELSSLQQGMRNSRAQTAYTLQQQRPQERRDEDLCKICYDNDIGVVLYPCGHFILCRYCAFKVSDCPVCRDVITHVIRTYKS